VIRLLGERRNERGGHAGGELRPCGAEGARERRTAGLEVGWLTRERFEHDRSERVQVGATIHAPAGQLLGGHVAGGANLRPRLRQGRLHRAIDVGDPEVGE
jgi:hypothetical protein